MKMNKHGNQIWRDFVGSIDVLWYDNHECTAQDGWESYPTTQDSICFGIWINKSTLEIMTFCEGDEIRVKCTTQAAFQKEMLSLHQWSAELQFSAIKIQGKGA